MSQAAPPEGLLNLLKPPGMTAHDVVAFMRRRLGTRRVGHAGTLDPLACGVLPVAVGAATRLLPYLRSGKEYRAEIVFGAATDTADAAGQILEARDVTLGREELEAALPAFRGTIRQQPPMVSAVHVGGKRLYELAREGKVVDRPWREVQIEAFELLAFRDGPRPTATLRVACGAGTYVRALAVDLGEALGVPAHLGFLLRTRAGDFSLAEARTLDEEPLFVDPEQYLAHLIRREASEEEVAWIGHGRPLEALSEPEGASVRLHHGGALLAIYERRGERLAPLSVFKGS